MGKCPHTVLVTHAGTFVIFRFTSWLPSVNMLKIYEYKSQVKVKKGSIRQRLN
jgi:hypothetical protein